MLKELKYLIYIFIIFLFFFLILRYYFSDDNKKKFYRSLNETNVDIVKYSENLILLKNNTENVVEYSKKNIDKNKKDYNFWNLINGNEK